MDDNVIQIGDLFVRRRHQRHWSGDARCPHLHLTWDDNGHIVTCDDCSKQIEPYWAMQMLASHYEKAFKKVQVHARSVAEDKAHNLHLIAARKVEAVWRSRTMVPCCPHCGHGILPEDQLGARQMGKKFEIARRAAKQPSGSGG